MTDVVPVWLQRMAVHQDYAWFVSLVLWGVVLLAWWRHPRRDADWTWLAVPGAMAMFTVAVQFIIYDPTFDWFQDRLVPGTTNVYVPAVIAVELLGDFLLTLGWSAVAAWWWWRGASLQGKSLLWRGTGLFLAAGAGGLTFSRPEWGTWALLLVVGAGGYWIWRGLTRGVSRVGLVAVAAMMAGSTVGPFASWAGGMQREAAATFWGLLAAGLQSLVAAILLAFLWRAALTREAVDEEERRRSGREWRSFAILATLWTVIGLAYAHRVGADNRNELQRNRLRSVGAEAMVFDPGKLSPLVGDAFRLETVAAEPRGAETPRLRAAVLATPEADALRRALARVVLETPFLDQARVLVIRDGWMLELASSRLPKELDEVEIVRRATADDQAAWEAKIPYIERHDVAEIDAPYYCRAPIMTRDGRVLGWLDYVRREFFQSLERKWRVGPLAVVALGLLGGFMVVLQRRGLREQERAWRRAAAETEANRLKTQFLAKVSHELRTPLQSLLGYSELLERDARDETQRGRLGRLKEHGDLLLRLVNDLLDLSAMEAGRLELRPQAVEIDQLVLGVVEGLRPRAEEKGLKLTCIIGDGLRGRWVSTDGVRVRQIVFNLVGNAVKFTARGEVEVSLVPLSETGLRLEVRDTGPGVSVEQQASLFTPFTRLETTAEAEGSGLGLAMVAALARMMGGAAGVESDGASGSRFWIHWQAPRVPAPAFERAGAPVALGLDALRGRRVLIAEDNALVRELFQSVLVELGAECGVAGDGETALQMALAGRYDAMVLDVSLPGIDGVEVARRLRTRGVSPGPLRIVGVSAHASGEDARRALSSGMDAFLSKPVSLFELASAIKGAPRPEQPTDEVDEVLSKGTLTQTRIGKLFRASAQKELHAVREAVASGDGVRIKRTAHYLANSAAAVNDPELLRACRDLESASEPDLAGDRAAALDRVELAMLLWL